MSYDPLEAAAILAEESTRLRVVLIEFARLVADTCNDPHLVQEAGRIVSEERK